MKETQSNIENRILYNLAEAVGLPEDSLCQFGLSPILLKSHRLHAKDKPEEFEPIEISGETFRKIICILQQTEARYKNNLSLKDDYSGYRCYASPSGLAGFCIDNDTKEACNLFSAQKGRGLGKEIFEYALTNYDCLGIANALPEKYDGYYKGNFDVITHHWEEDWDFPGDKEKAIWYGYILPKGTLSEEDRAAMILDGEKQKKKAFSKEDIEQYVQLVSKGKTTDRHQLSESETDKLNMLLSGVDIKKEAILSKALQQCSSVIRKNQMNSDWKHNTYPSKEIINRQMNEMWQHQFDKR